MEMHMQVTISPEVTSKEVRRSIILTLVSDYEYLLGGQLFAYDGWRIAYTGEPLRHRYMEFLVTLGMGCQFNVGFKFSAKRDVELGGPLESTIQALTLALSGKPSSMYQAVGRSFFSCENYGELGNGCVYMKGFHQSLRLTQMGLSLNIDTSAAAFYEPILVTTFVSKYFNCDLSGPLSYRQLNQLKGVLAGLKIECSHQKYRRCYNIFGLSAQPISDLKFTDHNTGMEKSVVQYFQDTYGKTLKYTYLPAIQAGNGADPVYIPMEVSTIIKGQIYTRKLNATQKSALLRASCQCPQDRERNIRQAVMQNRYSEDDLVRNEFGMTVSRDLVSVEARVLPPPRLKYHGTGPNSTVNPRKGEWSMNKQKMIDGAKVQFWTCISFLQNHCFNVSKFCAELVNTCQELGVDLNPTPLLSDTFASPNHVETALSEIHERAKPKQIQLLIVVLPQHHIAGFHGKIKRICETELGIVSQCCRPMQHEKNYKNYLRSLALKINVKGGGRNTVLEKAIQKDTLYSSDVPTIIFGADVTHPDPGDLGPSIAAVVASMDWPEAARYRALVSAQGHRQEIIADLGRLIRELVEAFVKSTKHLPARIIFYRDGVSDGEFARVLLHEVKAIKDAYSSIKEHYKPQLTFIVMQKRQRTCLFPSHHGGPDSVDMSGNVLAGTVVDTKICHPTNFDFFLCSHAGIKGTSRPVHYYVLYDENSFTADGLQLLTNDLCYTYARCTRSVSVVPPAYYAHLAAYRAREYMEGETSGDGSISRGGSATRAGRYLRPLPAIMENVKDVMFFC